MVSRKWAVWWGYFWRSTIIILAVLPAIFAPPSSLVAAISAAGCIAISITKWPVRSVTIAMATVGAAGLSLLSDVAYFGPHDLTLVWMPFEAMALWLLTGRAIRRVPRPQVVPVTVLVILAAMLLPLRYTLRVSPVQWTAAGALVVLASFPPIAAAWIGFYLRTLDDQRARAVIQARADQRRDLSANLHDFVAHELTGILMEAQAAQEAPLDSGQAHLMFGRIVQSSLRALDSMDQALQMLRDPAAPASGYRISHIRELAGRFMTGGGDQASLEMPDDLAGELSLEKEQAIYAVVLESLTNIRRHAPATSKVSVSVSRIPGAIEVRVMNDGVSEPALGDRRVGGTGLPALRDRLAALDGTLSCGWIDGLWEVRGVLPVEAPQRRTLLRWRGRHPPAAG